MGVEVIRNPKEDPSTLILKSGVNAYVILDSKLPRYPEELWGRLTEERFEGQMETLLERLETAISQIKMSQ